LVGRTGGEEGGRNTSVGGGVAAEAVGMEGEGREKGGWGAVSGIEERR